MNKALFSTYRFLNNHKFLFACALLLFLGGLLFGTTHIRLQEDISNVLPSSEKDAELNKVIQNTAFLDQIIVKISTRQLEDKNNLSEYASTWIEKIDALSGDQIDQIQGKIDAENLTLLSDFIFDHLPLFLTESDYQQWQKQLNPDSVHLLLQQHLKTLTTPAGFVNKNNIRRDPFNLLKRTFLQFGHARLENDLILENGFLMSPDKKNILLFVSLKNSSMDTEANEKILQSFEAVRTELNQKYAGKVEGSYFGAPFIASANAQQIKTDIQSTVTISFSVLILLLLLFFRKIWIPIVLFIPTILGALVAINVLIFFREDISGISLGIGSILLGISLDYSLHVLTHLRQGNSAESVFSSIGSPLLISALTTTSAFYCLLFLPSQALQDLGLFAGTSVFFTAIASLLIIPILYVSKPSNTNDFLNKLANYQTTNSTLIVFVLAGIVLLSSLFYDRVSFENDLSKMNYLSPELANVEEELNDILSIDEKSVYVVAYDSSLNVALEENERLFGQLLALEKNKKIERFTSIGKLILDTNSQRKKIDNWNSFQTENSKNTETLLVNEGEKIGFKASTFRPFYELNTQSFSLPTIREYDTLKSVFNLKNFIHHKNGMYTILNTVKLSPEQIDVFKNTLKTSKYSVIIDRKEINENLIAGLKNSFSSLINYSFFVVVLIVLVYFKRLEITLITLLPIALTWGLTLSLMYIFNIQFTVFNIIISSFIFGLGVDYSIMMSNALIKNYTQPSTIIRDTKIAILLSVLTTLLGIGALIFAKHPALSSISLVCLIGIISCVFITFTIQPWLFAQLIGDRPKKGKRPIRIHIWLISICLLSYFAIGSFIFSILSISILQLLPIKGYKKRVLLHKITSTHLRSVVSGHPFVRNKIINPHGEKFDQPAIIIANHSSSLDNLYLALLSSKLIYLVKDWVMKSPIFGLAVKQMGYIPVTENFDTNLEKLKKRVERGYSIVVFPEGKRSSNAGINRFHKGAFFLQKELKIDIIPVHILGASDTMKKGNFMIQSNSVHVVVEPRIAYDPKTYEKGISKQTRSISSLFKTRHRALIMEFQQFGYYERLILDNFRFKSDQLFQEIKTEIKQTTIDFDALESFIPTGATVLMTETGSKILPIYLTERDPKRKIYFLNPPDWMTNCFSLTGRYFNRIADQELDGLSCSVLIVPKLNEALLSPTISTIILLNDDRSSTPHLTGFTTVKHKGFTLIQRDE